MTAQPYYCFDCHRRFYNKGWHAEACGSSNYGLVCQVDESAGERDRLKALVLRGDARYWLHEADRIGGIPSRHYEAKYARARARDLLRQADELEQGEA